MIEITNYNSPEFRANLAARAFDESYFTRLFVRAGGSPDYTRIFERPNTPPHYHFNAGQA